MPDRAEKKLNAQGDTEQDDRKIVAVEEIARLLIKGMKTYAIYRHNLNVVESFLEPLVNAFDKFLDKYGALPLKVGVGGFRYRGVEVYKELPDQNGIANRLYREGVRKLRFSEGLRSDELLKLIAISATNVRGVGAASDGIVTLLWKASFEHIEYVVVEGLAPMLDGDRSMEATAEADVDSILSFVASKIRSDSGDIAKSARVLASDIELEIPDMASFKGAVIPRDVIRDSQAQKIQMELASEDEMVMMSKVLIIILATIRHEFDERVREDIQENLLIIIDTMLLKEEFKAITAMMSKLDDLASPQLKGSELRDRIERLRGNLTTALGAESRMERIGSIVAPGTVKDPASFSGYLALLGNDAFKRIPDLMEMTTSPENHKLMSGVMASRPQLFEEIIPRLVSSGRTPVIMEGLRLAGEHDFVGREKAIGGLLRHQSPIIKSAAAKALNTVYTDAAREILAKAFEECGLDVKMTILGAIGSQNQVWAGEVLAKFISGGEFEVLERSEQRSFIRAAAATHSQKAIEALNRILLRRSGLFHRRDIVSLKLMVVDAIRAEPSLPGFMLLQRQIQRGGSEYEVKAACKRAMNEIRMSLVGS